MADSGPSDLEFLSEHLFKRQESLLFRQFSDISQQLLFELFILRQTPFRFVLLSAHFVSFSGCSLTR